MAPRRIFWILMVLVGLAMPLGIWGPGLWDPWEMNQAFVARRMVETPRVLVVSSSPSTGVQAVQESLGDDVVLESVAAGAPGSFEGIRPRLSEKVFRAVVLDLDTTDPGDSRGADALARLLSALVPNNRSTTFLLVSGSGKTSPEEFRKAMLARVEETAEGDEIRDLVASRVRAVSDPAALAGEIRRALRDHAFLAQFKAQGQTRFLPPLEPLLTGWSLRAFGLSEFAARLPAAVMTALAILLLGLAVRRTSGERTASLALVALFSAPAILLIGRTVNGMAATMLWTTVGGILTAWVVRGESRSGLAGGLLLCVLVLLWLSGGMFAVVTLTAAVILVPLVLRSRDRRLWVVAGAMVLLAGGLALLTFLPEAPFSRQMRFTQALWTSGLKDDARNFDLLFHLVGFGLFPWSALLPLAAAAAVQADGPARRERLIALIFATVPMLALAVGIRPFHQVEAVWAPAAMLLMVFYLEDLQDDPLESRLLAFVSVGLFLVMWKDLSRSAQPLVNLLATDPPFAAPGKGDLAFPEGVALPGAARVFGLLGGLAMLVHGGRLVSAAKALPGLLARGRTFRVVLSVMGALIVADLVIFLALKWPALVQSGPEVQRGAILLRVFLTGPDILGLYLLTLSLVAARYWEPLYRLKARVVGSGRLDRMARWVSALEGPRSFGVWLALVSAGFAAVLVLFLIPTLSGHFSQKHLMETWRESAARAPGELVRHGVFSSKGTEDSNFYTAQVPELATRAQLLDRLKDSSRRTGVLLPKNQWSEILSAFRAANGGRFLPVLDDRSSRYILVASSLAPGDENRDWIAAATMTFPQFEALSGVERTSVNFDDRLEIVGWSVEPRAVRRGGKAVLRTWFRVLNKVDASYRIFLHVDRVGSSTRIHGDHWVWNLARENEDQTSCVGCFATTHWLKGDVVMDRYEIEVPIGSPSGPYDIWMGFYLPGGDKRLPVKAFDKEKVRHDGQNRVRLGSMTVE